MYLSVYLPIKAINSDSDLDQWYKICDFQRLGYAALLDCSGLTTVEHLAFKMCSTVCVVCYKSPYSEGQMQTSPKGTFLTSPCWLIYSICIVVMMLGLLLV